MTLQLGRKSNSCWGFGVPYLMKAQQKVLNAAWRQMMDNSGVTSGPQICVKPDLISPADKNWELSSRKIWWASSETEDVRKDLQHLNLIRIGENCLQLLKWQRN